MPTYDYECKECGHVFEVFQNMSDDPISTCDSCGGSVKRLIGGGLGVIFKGSGFYVTDNKSSSAGTAGKAASKKKSEGASSTGEVKKETAKKDKTEKTVAKT